ncbi:MAG: metallophosphoesterase family protein [Dehalococcoidales bacterium]|jgi:diadenosine tetraphosphatase ApaH/serine/threonine PP2A family protein phosphatase|nr:metallophosphoesterase family protein [Dehalococcoidales bacterium]MDD3994823.1 metallophosphoesterase family protein [Dehalococcoidales bacterium]NLT28617.1 metallophosphoesterase family protein [Dehalococcoidales bacterium]
MKYALLADIHSNLEALTAVLEDIERRGSIEELWVLGDIVGYGPDPSECIKLLRSRKHIAVSGNHDVFCSGKMDARYLLNPEAATACLWTERVLSAEDIEYLKNLPEIVERDDFMLVHGSPRDPLWEYVMSLSVALINFDYFRSKYCLVGHSHMPLVFKLGEDGHCINLPLSESVGVVLGKHKMIINPGGVGQPRDGDPRASYAIYDSEAKVIRLHRVPYDIKLTQQKMVKRNLPVRLISRLEKGL